MEFLLPHLLPKSYHIATQALVSYIWGVKMTP